MNQNSSLNSAKKWYVEWDYCCTSDNYGRPLTLKGALNYIVKNAKRMEAGTTGSTEVLQRIWITTR